MSRLVAAALLVGCGAPIGAIPADATATVRAEWTDAPGMGARAALQLWSATGCVELAETTEVRFEGVVAERAPRGGTHVAAAGVRCRPQFAAWSIDEGSIPFVFAVAHGDDVREVIVDGDGGIVRCDFAACAIGDPRGEE